MRTRLAIVTVWLWMGAGEALAATCSFDGSTGVLTVNLAGTEAEVKANATGILLDGVACGGATQTTTSQIVVNGNGAGQDKLTLRGKFAPGRNDTPETDDPEIEITLANGWQEQQDSLTIMGTVRADVWRVSASGINLNGDLDDDVPVPAAGRIYLRTLDGDDVVDASAYSGGAEYRFRVHGGDGNDTLTGSQLADYLYGEAGNDRLFGGSGNDYLYDGPGADVLRGNAGNDAMFAQALADAGDDFGGGGGADTVNYAARQLPGQGITVTIDGLADDGEPGENDNVRLDVENVVGGAGDDVLVGSSADNYLEGGATPASDGFDELYGGGGDDILFCINTGGCYATGDEGNDTFYGSSYDDVLDGGPGDDDLIGHNGNDTLTGGPGQDLLDGRNGNDVFFNADGFADTVDCGFNTDDPEPDPLDTFIDCENI